MTLRRTLKRSLSTTTRGLLQFGGSGGAAPSFTPADLTGLQLWLDASDSSTVLNSISPDTPATDGQTVRRWLDKSGNGLHANQATAANQPLLDADGQNSKGVLTFDGVNDFLTSGTTSSFNFLHNGTTSLVVVVAKVGTSADPNAVYAILDNGAFSGLFGVGYRLSFDDRVLTGRNNAIQSLVANGVGVAYSVSDSTNDNTFTPNAFHIAEHSIDADNASAGLRSKFRVDGGAEFTTSASTAAVSAANASNVLNIARSSSGAFYLAGGIAELIICNDPNTALRSSLRSYLASKWGITLS